MDPWGRATDIADRVLELVSEHAPSAEAEVNVTTGTSALTRFANSFIHQNVAEEIAHVHLRVANDSRVSSATLDGSPDDDTLRRVVANALEAARVRPPDADWPGLAMPANVDDPGHWDDATAAATPDERAARVADFVAAADGLETAGACRSTAIASAFVNSAGQRAAGRATSADIDGIARTGSSDGSARLASVRLAGVDGRSVGEIAARKARNAADPSDLEPGRYEVVLEPQCVTDILLFLVVYGFNGRAVEEGRSFVRVGEQQFDPAFTLRDDPTDHGQLGVGFDVEGTPKRPFDLVVDGVTRGVLHTRRTAAKAGTQSTGHAVEGSDVFGAQALNEVVAPGERTTDELIGSMERGLLVTDFWYTRILDPRTQVVTGLTRNGVWLVEGGQVARPVSNLRFTQSFVEALAPGAVKGVSSDRRLLYDEFGTASLVPSLHLASWNFTGGARG